MRERKDFAKWRDRDDDDDVDENTNNNNIVVVVVVVVGGGSVVLFADVARFKSLPRAKRRVSAVGV